ncbi:MAG: phosphoribosylformylglycinamidine cyclo-ligase [Methylacidiphilales bacterium]|nr:phosphoribosylformylglycinamidine cyclo-ligase [Candidatus Methylacidiphilales bacterium]
MDSTKNNISSSQYQRSGVDLEKGDSLIKQLSPIFASTHRKGVMGEVGNFAGIFDLKQTAFKDPLLVSSTDGVGTKLLLALEHDQLECLGADLVAMCVNDIIVCGAEPLFFLDYFSCGTLELEKAKRILSSIATHCRVSGCALLGGETAEMPGLYSAGKIDLAGFAVGAVERNAVLGAHKCQEGDWCIALRSNGLHSNGFSLVRSILNQHPATATQIQDLLRPTTIYIPHLLPLFPRFEFHGLAHITGGGIVGNLPRSIPSGYYAELERNWNVPEIFLWLQQVGKISRQEMDEVFNQGVGMILIIAKDDGQLLLDQLNKSQSDFAWHIGTIKKGQSNCEPHVLWKE